LQSYASARSLPKKWAHRFTRLFTIPRAPLWEKYDLLKLLAWKNGFMKDFLPRIRKCRMQNAEIPVREIREIRGSILLSFII
jgi:hypothetical protein